MVLLAILLPAVSAVAQPPTDMPVAEVRLEGLERASESLIRSQLEVQPGRPLARPAVSRDIRRLYTLGFFETIQVDASVVDGELIVTYQFQEKQLIDEVLIIGNDKVNDRRVREVLTWREGDSFVEDAWPEQRIALLDLYSSRGFPNATVDIIVEEVGPSQVRLTYMIDEGRRARIRKITFEGNEVLSDRQLRKLMTTSAAFWFIGGRYEESVFEQDLQKILDEYGNYGRLEAEIVSTQFDYGKKGKRFTIIITVSEGPEYRVHSLGVQGNRVFDDDEILNIIEVHGADVHDRGQVNEDAQLIQQGYEDSGYIDARVVPLTTMDRETKTTDVIHQIEEGELQYIREVKITGNSVTRDDVVRRHILIRPGERFDGSAIRGTDQELDRTGYFDNVNINVEDIPGEEQQSNLLIDVEEGQTGFFNFGGGFSTDEGFSGFAELRLSNFDISNWPTFRGGGQTFRLRASLGDVRSDFNLSFTEPEFLGYPVSAGIDLFSQEFDPVGSNYSESTLGAQLRFGKALSPTLRTQIALRSANVDIDDISFRFNPQLKKLEGGDVTNSVTWTIVRETTNHFRDPTDGSLNELSLTLAGLGGDNDFYLFEHDMTWYHALSESGNWVMSYRSREGYGNTYSGSTPALPISHRFFAGGTSTVRGYESRSIGPEIREFYFFGDDVPIGGELRLINNLEVKYKVSDLLRLYTFLDFGGVWEQASDFNFGDLRYSLGLGFGIDVPQLGPIRVDYGFPINPDDDQGSGRLHLTTGFRF